MIEKRTRNVKVQQRRTIREQVISKLQSYAVIMVVNELGLRRVLLPAPSMEATKSVLVFHRLRYKLH
jgi:hypothetical protein